MYFIIHLLCVQSTLRITISFFTSEILFSKFVFMNLVACVLVYMYVVCKTKNKHFVTNFEYMRGR